MSHRQYAIIGLGYFGKTVALDLMNQRHEVLGVDADESHIDALADHLTHTIIADPTDENALKELDLERFDAVLIDLDTIESSTLCTTHLLEMGVNELWVRALSDNHYKLLRRLKVDRIVYPEHDHGVHVAQSLNHRSVIDMISLGDDQYVIELEVTESLIEQYSGKDGETGTLYIGRDQSARLVAVKRQSELDCTPNENTRLEAGDHVILIGHLKALRHFDTPSDS